MTTDELGLDAGHRSGALTRYFAERWLKEPSAEGEQLIAWLLEAALGRNVLYFIEKTKEYVDEWGGRGKIVPASAFDGFVLTGDPVEDTIIPHAVLVWTCMNDQPWPEEVYHRWLDSLLAAGSAEAAYLAASLWPAHDLMAKVTYRPARWLVYRGQLDAEAERLILTEMLRGDHGPRTSLYGSLEYDNVLCPILFPMQYIKRHGFTHPICGLVGLTALEWDNNLKDCIQEALAAPIWSEGVKGAAMLLYLSLKEYGYLNGYSQEVLNTLEQNLFKLDDRHINIINFHIDKIEKIDYDLIKDYIKYLIILYNYSIKIFSKYMSIGIKSRDILYIGENFKNIILNLMLKEREKVELWLEKQADDLRIKDLLLATYMTKRIDCITIDEELKTEQVEKRIEDIYGEIKYFDKVRLFIDQARIYSSACDNLHKICDFIDDILKRDTNINFIDNFRKDYSKIMRSWHPNRNCILEDDMFLKSKHIGLYLYYEILKEWSGIILNFVDNVNKEKEFDLYLYTSDKVIKNLHLHALINIEIKLDLYLNKIESNNLPYEELKYELVNELIDIIENNFDEILKYLNDEGKLEIVRKFILSNISLIEDKLRNPRIIELFMIKNKSQNVIMY